MYLEASGRDPGTTAILGTPELDRQGPYCVTFFYHIFGRHRGNLTVAELLSDDDEDPLDINPVEQFPDSDARMFP